MKKVIFAIGLVVSLASCSGTGKGEATVASDSTVTVAVDSAAIPLNDSTAVDSIKAK